MTNRPHWTPWMLALLVGALLTTVGLTTGGAEPLATRSTPEPAKGYGCTSDSCRDPFQSWIEEPSEPPAPRVVCPHRQSQGKLERFDLSVLKVTGLVWGEMGRRALIQTPDHKSHTVSIGSGMGLNCGRVAAIAADHLLIQETYQDHVGNRFRKDQRLQLGPKPNRS